MEAHEAYRLRAAIESDIARLIEIEDAAGRMYATVQISGDLEGIPAAQFRRAIDEDTLWVLADDDDRAQAFALCQPKPDALHLRELDVHPNHMRQKLGRRLIEHVREVAAQRGLPRVTLTTFAEVPWNAPLYKRYGFRVIEPSAMAPWLREIRDEEDRGPLAAWPRVAMASPVSRSQR